MLCCQKHRCGSYCERKTTKNNYTAPTCRFEAPWTYDIYQYPDPDGRPPDIVAKQTEGDDKDSKIVFIPRRNHAHISNYTPWASLLWRANNDTQAVFSYDAVIRYLVKYVTKGDFDSKQLHLILANALQKTVFSGKDALKKKLMRLVNSINNEREISIQDAICNIYGIDLRYMSIKVIQNL